MATSAKSTYNVALLVARDTNYKTPKWPFYKGLVKNKPSNIRALLAEAGIAPWSLPHIGFFDDEGIMEIMYYKKSREKVLNALEKFKDVKKIKDDKFLGSLSHPVRQKLYSRMESVNSLRRCLEPVNRYFTIFKKK